MKMEAEHSPQNQLALDSGSWMDYAVILGERI